MPRRNKFKHNKHKKLCKKTKTHKKQNQYEMSYKQRINKLFTIHHKIDNDEENKGNDVYAFIQKQYENNGGIQKGI